MFEPIKANDLVAVKMLIAAKCNLKQQTDDEGYEGSPFIYAAGLGRLEILKMMLESKKRFAKDLLTGALIESCLNGHFTVMTFLIDRGAELSVALGYYHTPLTAAVYGHHLDIVKFLVEAGAKVEQRNGGGVFPLLMAAVLGNQEIFNYLEPLTKSITKRKEARKELSISDKPRQHPAFAFLQMMRESEEPIA
jgi:uncharacterized protein